MNDVIHSSLLLPALLTWSEQVLVLAGAGALAALAIKHPKARLLFWQGLLVAMLLLPAIEPWKPAAVQVDVTADSVGAVIAPTGSVASSSFRWRDEYWLWIIAAGAALRLLWVAAGLFKLRRYRNQAEAMAAPPLLFASEAANWYASASVPGPVTYGWRTPVILLPSSVLDLPAGLREAIECHELIHVRRRDWLFVMAEAVVRSLLWFHPAVWFVLARIQLAREQAVDREAVELLRNRETYLDALVAVAGYRLHPELAPAPLFLRKRHLLARVDAVVKETNMSRSKIVAACAAVCSAVPLALCAAAWLFPFVSEAQTAPDSPGIVVNAGATLLHRAPVRAPEPATSGTVILSATLDASGEVTDAHVLSGPDALRRSALSSVLQWHYQPGPTQAQISIQYGAGGGPSVTAPAPALPVFVTRGGRAGAASLTYPASIKSIQFTGITAEAERELRTQLPFHEGDTVNQADVNTIQNAVRAFDSHLSAVFVPAAPSGGNEVAIRIYTIAEPVPTIIAPPPPPAPPSSAMVTGAPPPAPDGAVKVGGNVMSQKLVTKVTPVYPPIAKQARIQGTVELQAIIAKDGTIANLSLVAATSPLLVQNAMDAVRQWVYAPTMLNGQPVQVVTNITVNFSLTD